MGRLTMAVSDMRLRVAKVWLALGFSAASVATAQGAVACGAATMIAGKDGKQLDARSITSDGSLVVRASLAVNPDGGVSAYAVGDHGFTYIANGIARWVGGHRTKCDASCSKDFRDAERAEFGLGTPEFCVFALEVEGLAADSPVTKCTGGQVVGNGKGKPRKGATVETVTGGTIQTYVSMTSATHRVNGAQRYLDSESIAVLVAPDSKWVGHVVRISGKGLLPTYAVVGDKGTFGEGSIALHQMLRAGKVSPQKPGPIPVEQRCMAAEKLLGAPFLSRPDKENDTCRSGYTAKSISDIRAYQGIEQTLDFAILGNARFPIKSGTAIQVEVSASSIEKLVTEAGYTDKQIADMLACLAK